MKKIIFIILFFISAGNCFGQQVTFQKTYGGTNYDYGQSAQQTADGGYIITGTTENFIANYDVYLIKTDSIGDILWTKTFGGTNSDFGESVQQTIDGGYIVSGQTLSFGAGGWDIYLIKTDTGGNMLWAKTFGGGYTEDGPSVQQTTDGGYIITGYTNSFGTGSWDVYLIKTDVNGDSLWTKTYGGTADSDGGRSVQQTTDGGYIIAGFTSSFGVGGVTVYLIKTDANGDILWTKTFGETAQDDAFTVRQTTDGGYVVVGRTGSSSSGLHDLYLIKTDANGNLLWSKIFGGINNDLGYSVQQTTDGGYIITGSTASFGTGLYDIYLVKTDVNGDSLWTKTFGVTGNEFGYYVQQTTDNGYIIIGSFGGGGVNVYLIKTDSLGNSGCNEGSTATIVTTPATQVTSPATIVTSPPTVVTTPTTIVGSGGTVTTLCTTVGIAPISNLQSSIFNISPNPTTNNFTITFPNTINKGVIEIYNVMGEKVFEENVVNVSQKEIRINNINAGIYFVKVKGGAYNKTEKLVVQ